MESIAQFFSKNSTKRIIIFAIIVLALVSVRSMINVILLTFIFAFLMNSLVTIVTRKFPINRNFAVLFFYATIIGLLTYVLVKYLPVITSQVTQLFTQVQNFYLQPHDNVYINY